MKIKLVFKVKSKEIKADIKRTMVSYLKHSIESYDKKMFKEIYKNNKMKKFTFSLYLPGCQKQGDITSLSNDLIILELSSGDEVLMMNMYYALSQMRNINYPMGNTFMMLDNMDVFNSKKNKAKKISIKMKSPLVIRDRKDNKDKYYTVSDEEFEEKFKENIKNELEGLNLDCNPVISIQPLKAKMIVDKTFNIMVPASTGYFLLTADEDTLTALQNYGIGSRRGEGFGYFEVIKDAFKCE